MRIDLAPFDNSHIDDYPDQYHRITTRSIGMSGLIMDTWFGELFTIFDK